MKTQVIQIDPHDDVISIRDKMSWVKASRMLLVFPRRTRVLSRPLDLQLLKRHADHLGVQLALVTRSVEIRDAAGELGISIFQSAAVAQRRDWKDGGEKANLIRQSPRPDLWKLRAEVFQTEAAWQNHPVVRLGLFSLAVLAVLAVLTIFIPSATIVLEPKIQTQNQTLEVSASQAVKSISLAGSLPVATTTIEVDGNKTAPSTGTAVFPDQPAQGIVRFRNQTTEIIGIPSGTVVETVGGAVIRFATTADGVADAGVGKTVDLPVQAINGGSDGNLPAGSLIAIEGDLGTSLSVSNPDPTSGGTEQTNVVPTGSDRTKLYDDLLGELQQKALLQLPQILTTGDVVIPDSLKVSETITETFVPAEGQPGNFITLSLQVQFQALYVKGMDIQSLAKGVMDSNLPVGFTPAVQTIQVTNLNAPATGADGIAHWQMVAERPLQARIDPSRVAQFVAGLKLQEANRRLAGTFSLASKPNIRVIPSWWPWAPWLPFRITTVVK